MTFYRKRATAVALILYAGTLIACKKSTPVTPDPVLTSNVFTGTLAPLGKASHTFTVNYTYDYTDGSITVTSLTTVANQTPLATTIGIAFGLPSLGTCQRDASLTNPTAPLNVELRTPGFIFGPYTYCVEVFDNPDSPTLTEPVNYSITVKHY